MRWSLLVLMMLPLAGCMQEGQDPGPAPASDERVLTGDCPLTYPDGSAFPCTADEVAWTPVSMPGRPPLEEGWKCAASHQDDWFLSELYTTIDGDVGFYWEWTKWKDDGLAHQRVGFLESADVGANANIPYAEKGFVSLGPQDPDGPVDIHNTFRQWRIWVLEDEAWVHPENVTWLVGSWGGITLYGARLDWDGGPYFLQLYIHNPDDDEHNQYSNVGFQGLVAGRQVIIDATGDGIKHNGRDFEALKRQPGTCQLTAGLIDI